MKKEEEKDKTMTGNETGARYLKKVIQRSKVIKNN